MCFTKRGEVLVVIPVKLNKNETFIKLEESDLMKNEVNEKTFGKTIIKTSMIIRRRIHGIIQSIQLLPSP